MKGYEFMTNGIPATEQKLPPSNKEIVAMSLAHTQLVRNLLKPGQEIKDDMTDKRANLMHIALGIGGEAGELQDAIKKHAVYNKHIDRANIVEELGDMEFYLEALRQATGITREETISQNILKLNKRYQKGSYSDTDAQIRADKIQFFVLLVLTNQFSISVRFTTMAPEPKKEQKSIFAAMKENRRLNQNMAKAKQAVAVREFDGPDGDYYGRLNRTSNYTKDNVLGIVFEFILTGEGEYQGNKAVIIFQFKDNPEMGQKMEDVQNDLMCMLQVMNIDTANLDDKQMDIELMKLIKENTELHLRVKRVGKKNFLRWSVVGLAAAAEDIENTEYTTEEETVPEEVTEEVPEEVNEEPLPDDQLLEAQESEEWEEVPEEPVVEEVPEADPDDTPTAWVGYSLKYKNQVWEVLAAEDDTRKVKVKNKAGKVYNLNFDDCEKIYE